MLNNYKYIKIICIFLIVFLCLESINILYLHNLQKNNSSFDKQEKTCSDNLILIQPQEEKEELSLYNSSFSNIKINLCSVKITSVKCIFILANLLNI